MKLNDVAALLEAEIVSGHEYLDRQVKAVFASDLMSDVLTIDSSDLLLLTGLVNVQTIRTSEMSDIQNIILVRNKTATPEMIQMAVENEIVLMQCSYSMYRTCGILYQNGLLPVY